VVIVIQQRARVTRKIVLQAAAEEFDRHGYVRTTLGMIHANSGVGKGALYHHFPSKSELARAVIAEGLGRLDVICAQQMRRHCPAGETLVELSYALAAAGRDEAMVRAAFRLVREVGDGVGDIHSSAVGTWIKVCRGLVERAIAEGDVRADLDPGEVAEVLVAAAYGAQLHATATGTVDRVVRRVEVSWRMLLPALTTPGSGMYLERFATRRTPITRALPSTESAT
jgi:AcrR family transcriptional regulator